MLSLSGWVGPVKENHHDPLDYRICACCLLMAAATAPAAFAQHEHHAWCLQGGSGTVCAYKTLAQCRASKASGQGRRVRKCADFEPEPRIGRDRALRTKRITEAALRSFLASRSVLNVEIEAGQPVVFACQQVPFVRAKNKTVMLMGVSLGAAENPLTMKMLFATAGQGRSC